jgi:hypothetical protein
MPARTAAPKGDLCHRFVSAQSAPPWTAPGWFYHLDMGYEYFMASTADPAYMYDLAPGHWWFTRASLFPSIFDFTLNSWLYYFPNTTQAGHYTTSPRSFFNFNTGLKITM